MSIKPLSRNIEGFFVIKLQREDVGSENNLTKYTIHPKAIPCLDNQDLMLPEHYIMLWAGE